ncbi:MAG: hypothetical protein IPK16_19080 [Anaerolineales bacterium]|nr:hypothetical protein [Anaerolineales bacterium]
MAVGIAAGVDQMASIFPVFFHFKVQISLLLIMFITLMNLRGVKESGRVFAVPTYWFVLMMIAMIGYGLWQAITGQLGIVHDVPGVRPSVSAVDRVGLRLSIACVPSVPARLP